MKTLTRHLSRCFLAGIVALLPIGGLVLAVVYLESVIAGSWLARQRFYFPGCGLLLAAAGIYLIGLAVSTFIGRWLWERIDALLIKLPALGQLYGTLKQILGYGEGKDALFQRVVLVASGERAGEALGLVTSQTGAGGKGAEKLVVFVPGSPNPAQGRLLLLDPELARAVDMPVSEAMKALISLGKVPIPVPPSPAGAKAQVGERA